MATFKISNSKLSTYRRCPKSYDFKYMMKLQPKQRKIQLERGTWIHELLMVDADDEDWMERHRLLTKKFYLLWEEERDELGDLPNECERIMRAYKRHYKADEERYRVIDTELDELITMPNGLTVNIIIDKIVEDKHNGGLLIVDYKTRKSFEDTENMMLDPQLTTYFWGVEHMGYKPLLGGMYDEIRTKAPTVPETLVRGGLSKRKDIDTDVYTYMHTIRRHDLDPNDYSDILTLIARRGKDRFFRRTTIPQDPPVVRTTVREAVITANTMIQAEATGQFPRTFDKSCKWCDYQKLCVAQLYGGDITPLIKMNYQTRRRDEPVPVRL